MSRNITTNDGEWQGKWCLVSLNSRKIYKIFTSIHISFLGLFESTKYKTANILVQQTNVSCLLYKLSWQKNALEIFLFGVLLILLRLFSCWYRTFDSKKSKKAETQVFVCQWSHCNCVGWGWTGSKRHPYKKLTQTAHSSIVHHTYLPSPILALSFCKVTWLILLTSQN